MDFGILRRLQGQYEHWIKALYQEMLSKIQGLSPTDTVRYLGSIGSHPTMKKLCDNLARRMVTAVKAENEKTWRAAARKGTRSKDIYMSLRRETQGALESAMQAIVDENSKLIRSVPGDLAKKISEEALERYMKGERWEEAARSIIAQAPYLSKSRAKLIARTESSKANEAMTEVRARQIGSDWYFWRSSHDERVRYSHQKMDGVLCSFDWPPNPEAFYEKKPSFGPYHAGCCPNCRCYAEPVIDENDLPDSMRVCEYGRKPRYMTKAQVLDMMRGS